MNNQETHSVCNARIKEQGGKAMCCECTKHECPTEEVTGTVRNIRSHPDKATQEALQIAQDICDCRFLFLVIRNQLPHKTRRHHTVPADTRDNGDRMCRKVL